MFASDFRRLFEVSDIMLQDILEDDLEFIAEKLGSAYLGETKQMPTFPVKGLIWDDKTSRLFFNLTIE
jgi:hypothetical protein